MPPTDAATKVKDPEYSNWLKVGLALYYLKDGLHSFIQGEVDAMHQFFLQMLYHSSVVPKPKCSSCHSKDVEQNRNTHVWKFRSPCPSNLCDVWLKELMTVHTNPTSNKIYCENCDVTAWPFVPWECAKLYMPRGQPPTNISPSHSDAQALLTLMASCTYFHGKLSTAGLTLTHTVSKIRNSVMHSGEMKLSDGDRKSFIQDIIHLLEDPTHLISLKECKEAVAEINRINDDTINVFLNLDLEMKTLSECLNDCRRELGIHKKDTEVTVESLKDEFTKLKGQFVNFSKETKDKFGDLDAMWQQTHTSVAIVSSGLDNVKQQLSSLDKEIQVGKASSSEMKDQFDNHAKEIQDKFGDLDAKWQQTDTSVTIVSSSVENVKQQVSKHDKEIQEIQASSSEAKDLFDNHAKETKDRFGNLDAKCQQTDTSVTILSKTVSSDQEVMKQELSRLDKEIQEVKASSSEAMKVADQVSAENMESDISKLRDDLIKAYRNVRCVQVSPIYEKMRCNIDTIYVDLVIEEKQDSRNIEEESKYVSTQCKDAQPNSRKVTKVTSYKQIFLDETGSKLKRVYLRGKGGLGKTTFCRKVLHAWCNAYEERAVAQDGYFQDEAVLKMFDLLFYINLREVSVKEKSLITVINAQFPLEEVPSKNVLETMLKLNGEKILFILDGLDEMIVKGGFIDNVVTCRAYPNCCFMISSRPWKISQMELYEDTEIDLLLDLEGFSKENAIKCAQKIFENCYKERNVIEQFKSDIAHNKLAKQLIHVPLLLLFLTLVWYKKKSLPRKRHELYISFINVLADRTEEKYKKDPNHMQMRFSIDDTCIKCPLPSKISETSLVVEFGEGFLLSLCEVAHHFLLSSEKENSLVFKEKTLLKALGNRGKEKLYMALNLGILSVTDSMSYLNRKTNVTFIHKTMQEFFTAVYFIFNPDKLANFISSIADFSDVHQNENIIVFLVGLMPELGKRVLEKVNKLFRAEWEVLRTQDELETTVLRSEEELEKDVLKGQAQLEIDMLMSRIKQDNSRYRLNNIIYLYLRCKDEVIGEDILLNITCLLLPHTDFELHPWNPAFLQVVDLKRTSPFTYDKDCMLLDLRGLTGLTYLALNGFSCDLYLPRSGSLSVLIVLYVTLSSNCCDVLGSTLTHCTKLEKLKICHTNLHNCLLDLSNMTELTNLDISKVTLSSSCCDVLGRTIRHCPTMKTLSIHNTDIHNCLLDLSNMTELMYLNMSWVTLSSSCCDALGSTLKLCTKLKKLTIYHTDLHNCLLDLSNMTELTDLHMSMTTLSSSCCDVLGMTLAHCSKLAILRIHNTYQVNCLIDLSNLTELRNLDISEVKLSSTCCDVLGSTLIHCTKLEILSMSNLDLHNCLLDLSNMTELINLDLSWVTLSSSCCDVLGSTLTHCTKLELFSICNSDLHNCLLDLSNMTKLTNLKMSELTLSSSCCDVLGRTLTFCTMLKILSIDNTDLHNCLLDLSKMTELRFVFMSGVTLSSSCCDVLGSTLTHCIKLDTLCIVNTDLHNCLLDLSNMTELTDLVMSGVTLSSSCCDALGSTLTHCTKLRTIRVYNTDLHNFVFDPSNMTSSCPPLLIIVRQPSSADGLKSVEKSVWKYSFEKSPYDNDKWAFIKSWKF